LCLARRASGLCFAARLLWATWLWLFAAWFRLFAAFLGFFAAGLGLGACWAVGGAVGNRASSAARLVIVAWLRACWAGCWACLLGAAVGL